jgi:nitrate/TMAO reductase-like tetraheme cytochrome c subunit
MNRRTIVNKKLGWMLAAMAVVALSGMALAQNEFIGAKKCKMCHKVSYASWETLAHAKAFEQLKPEEQSDPECLKCHATGGTADLPGVQCEACHGAGSGYKSMKIMKDREAAVAAGLVIPDEALCRSCHEGAPHDQPAFDYETAKVDGQHEFKEK